MKENKDVKVSVVIPVYNVEAYLPACLDSVLGQTLKEIEVICVDDKSTDRCPKILDEYAKKDGRVIVICLQKNSQQGFARNRGMEIASGEYLYLLDSDDMIETNAMEELYRYAKTDDLDAVFFDSRVVFESEALAKKHASYPAGRSGSYEDRIYRGSELFRSFIEQKDWTCYIQRMFWKREFLEKEDIRFPEGHEHEDETFAFEGIFSAEKVKYWKKEYFIRRVRENSVVTSPVAPKNFYGYFRCFLEMTEFLAARRQQYFLSEEEQRAADANIGRMYYKMDTYYDQLAEKEDLSQWFQTEEEQKRFLLFEQVKKAKTYPAAFTALLIPKIRHFDKVFIYGTGMNARIAWKGITDQGILVEGFFVTDPSGNPKTLFGRPVMKAADYQENRDGAVVIIAVTKGYQQEIIGLLNDLGWAYICFDDRG